jgi:dihydrofolate reductase
MRKVILGSGISLDGYLARRDGGLDFLRPPKGYSMGALFETLDTVAFGRKTFDEAVRRSGGSYKSPMRIPTYVFSKSQPAGERDGVTFTDQTPAAFVDTIRKQPAGKHILVMGGGELARAFLQDDVVDELVIGLYPVLLGDGIPFFPSGFPQRDFRLVESKSYEPDGFLELKYARIR